MTDEPTAKPLEPIGRNRLASYVDAFGFPFPRPQIVKLASKRGAMGLLEEMLEERVKAGRPVEDWNDFGREFNERMRQEITMRPDIDLRARPTNPGASSNADDPHEQVADAPRPGRLTAYVNKFGFPFPSPQTVKMASSFGMMTELEKMLQERVDANEPVTDWNAFALELRERVGREYARQSVSDMRERAIESGQVRGEASGDGTSAPDVAGAIRRVQTPQELDRLRARMAQAFGAKITGGVLPQAPTSEPRDE